MQGLDEIRKGMTVHKVEGDTIHASQGYKMLRSMNGGKELVRRRVHSCLMVEKGRGLGPFT